MTFEAKQYPSSGPLQRANTSNRNFENCRNGNPSDDTYHSSCSAGL